MPVANAVHRRIHRNGWTPERRARQALAIRRWHPWTRSTGPRTPAGKAVSSGNARKHGFRGAAGRELLAALSAQKKFLQAVNLALKIIRLQQKHKKLADKLMDQRKDKQNELLSGMAVKPDPMIR